jgi:D-glycero-D-manno-heptose 1,7-bisphosphate phosphatase
VADAAVFVDRDGVISHDRPDYVKSWDEVEFIPGALEGLRLLAGAGRRVLVITNQSAIGRGVMSQPQLEGIHARLSAIVTDAGGRIEAFLVCPHVPEDRCACRKPYPGLLYQAQARFGIDLKASYLVGDFETDMVAAAAAQCHSILVLSGRTHSGVPGAAGDHVAPNLLAAAQLILSRKERAWQRVA